MPTRAPFAVKKCSVKHSRRSLKLETQKRPWLDSLLRSLLGLVGQLSEEGIHGSCR